jgi:hypothetical protein
MLKHPFVFSNKREIYSFYDSFKNAPVKTFRAWIENVETISQNLPDEDSRLKYKGDMLEVLSEIFFNSFSADESVGLKDYTPVPLSEDYGVDAVGINPAGTRCAVQCKYKSFQPVLYEELAKTFTSALCTMNCDVLKENSIYVFTTAVEFTTAIEKQLGNKVRRIDFNVISRKVDNNHTFWQYAYDIIFETLDK